MLETSGCVANRAATSSRYHIFRPGVFYCYRLDILIPVWQQYFFYVRRHWHTEFILHHNPSRASPILRHPSMSPDNRGASGQAPEDTPSSRARDFFSVPAPIKRIFDQFPLVTYPSNDLPHHSGTAQRANRLFVFTDPASARRGRPSFNPQCLKWQVRWMIVKLLLIVNY
jgi:hypothetical protein